MEMTMLLWLYTICAFFSATTLLRRKGAADRRALLSVLGVGAVSTVGVLIPQTGLIAFWAGTAGFVIFMLAPGLLVRLGRQFAVRGSFHPACHCLHTAVILFPAAGFRSERDLYRALRDHGGIHHPAAAEVRARIAALSSGPMLKAAPATLVLIVVILLAFAVLEVSGDSRSLLTLLEFGANHGPLVSDGEPYRLLTAVLLHSGWLHLIFNVGALWMLGRWVEPELGPARTLFVFFLSGLLGNVASLALYGEAQMVSVGASGGAMGLIGCATMLLLRPGGDPQRARRLPSLLLIIFGTLLMGAFVPGIDNGAHIGGLITGGLLGVLFTRVSRFPEGVMRSVAALFLVLTAAAVFWVIRDLPHWRRLVPFETKAFSLERPQASELPENESCFEISWRLIKNQSVGMNLSIKFVKPPPDPEQWLADRFLETTGQKPTGIHRISGPVPGLFAAADVDEEHVELVLLKDSSDRPAALLSFVLPRDDPVIHKRWVEPMLSSFRFR